MAHIFEQLVTNIVRQASRSGAPHRTGMPVRAGSLEAGTFEERYWLAPQKHEMDNHHRAFAAFRIANMRAWRAYRADMENQSRPKYRVASADLEVHRHLTNLARLVSGKLYPSVASIADAIGRSRSAVFRSLALLRDIGLIEWQRRFQMAGSDETGKTRYEQTSNVYRLRLPAYIARMLPKRLQPVPIPDDHASFVKDQHSPFVLPPKGFPKFFEDQAELQKIIDRINVTYFADDTAEPCESKYWREPLQNYKYNGQKDTP